MTPASPTSVLLRDLEQDLQRSLTALTELALLVERAAAYLDDRAPTLAHDLRMRAWRIARGERRVEAEPRRPEGGWADSPAAHG